MQPIAVQTRANFRAVQAFKARAKAAAAPWLREQERLREQEPVKATTGQSGCENDNSGCYNSGCENYNSGCYNSGCGEQERRPAVAGAGAPPRGCGSGGGGAGGG